MFDDNGRSNMDAHNVYPAREASQQLLAWDRVYRASRYLGYTVVAQMRVDSSKMFLLSRIAASGPRPSSGGIEPCRSESMLYGSIGNWEIRHNHHRSSSTASRPATEFRTGTNACERIFEGTSGGRWAHART
jgi:hypothetical protein